jgi:hypothetical protein
MDKELQLNGLPIEGKFDEISTHDFAENGSTFILKPDTDGILEFTGVKMDFDSKLEYKPIKVSLFAHGVEGAVSEVIYPKLKNWKHKSHHTEVDDYTFEGGKIVTYERQFADHVYLISDSLLQYLGNGIKVQGLERVEISIEGGQAITDKDGNEVEMVQGRYDAIVYKATDKNKQDWEG